MQILFNFTTNAMINTSYILSLGNEFNYYDFKGKSNQFLTGYDRVIISLIKK